MLYTQDLELIDLINRPQVTLENMAEHVSAFRRELDKVTERKEEIIEYLKELDICLSLLKVHVRLSYKYQYISNQNYATWSNIITDICNMLGGWINSCQKR